MAQNPTILRAQHLSSLRPLLDKGQTESIAGSDKIYCIIAGEESLLLEIWKGKPK